MREKYWVQLFIYAKRTRRLPLTLRSIDYTHCSWRAPTECVPHIFYGCHFTCAYIRCISRSLSLNMVTYSKQNQHLINAAKERETLKSFRFFCFFIGRAISFFCSSIQPGALSAFCVHVVIMPCLFVWFSLSFYIRLCDLMCVFGVCAPECVYDLSSIFLFQLSIFFLLSLSRSRCCVHILNIYLSNVMCVLYNLCILLVNVQSNNKGKKNVFKRRCDVNFIKGVCTKYALCMRAIHRYCDAVSEKNGMLPLNRKNIVSFTFICTEIV